MMASSSVLLCLCVERAFDTQRRCVLPVTEYLWDVDNDSLLMETDGDGNPTAIYTNTPDPYGELISQHRDGQTYFHHYDGVEDTRQVTDESQNVVEAATYTAFGEIVEKTSSIINPFGYKGALGYYTNGQTSDIYVRRRPYEPKTGRWLLPDPITFLDGVNGYWYIANSPLRTADPSGLQGNVSLCGGSASAPFMDRIRESAKPGCDFEWYKGPKVGQIDAEIDVTAPGGGPQVCGQNVEIRILFSGTVTTKPFRTLRTDRLNVVQLGGQHCTRVAVPNVPRNGGFSTVSLEWRCPLQSNGSQCERFYMRAVIWTEVFTDDGQLVTREVNPGQMAALEVAVDPLDCNCHLIACKSQISVCQMESGLPHSHPGVSYCSPRGNPAPVRNPAPRPPAPFVNVPCDREQVWEC